jgi:hypothetical protein
LDLALQVIIIAARRDRQRRAGREHVDNIGIHPCTARDDLGLQAGRLRHTQDYPRRSRGGHQSKKKGPRADIFETASLTCPGVGPGVYSSLRVVRGGYLLKRAGWRLLIASRSYCHNGSILTTSLWFNRPSPDLGPVQVPPASGVKPT